MWNLEIYCNNVFKVLADDYGMAESQQGVRNFNSGSQNYSVPLDPASPFGEWIRGGVKLRYGRYVSQRVAVQVKEFLNSGDIVKIRKVYRQIFDADNRIDYKTAGGYVVFVDKDKRCGLSGLINTVEPPYKSASIEDIARELGGGDAEALENLADGDGKPILREIDVSNGQIGCRIVVPSGNRLFEAQPVNGKIKR